MKPLLTTGTVILVIGLLLASETTLGVALVGTALYCAVLARIRQADHHHQTITRAATPTPAPAQTGPPPLLRVASQAD